MKILHFQDTNSPNEYLVVTHSDSELEWLDHAKPGYVLETVADIGATSRGDEFSLPCESVFVKEPF